MPQGATQAEDDRIVGVTCGHCDFGTGQRGMDSCGRCDGTGSQLFVRGMPNRFPNTEQGYGDALRYLREEDKK
jgi:hypothetical protein